ncbi:hypothetical protein MYX07_05030 [Patescibacteria group bacterium AH-259-L07]|nr:hypothetical protein [Patescibacteria group bacterium AH-259-L07]
MAETNETPEGTSGAGAPQSPVPGGKKGLVLLVVGIVILLIVVVVLVFTIFFLPSSKAPWYAVFLTNGRTYFGHIVKQSSEEVVLRDVYYIQVQQLEPTEGEEEAQPQLSLVSITDELHAPESEMQINREHVLFIEKLQGSSQVVTTLEQQLAQ